MLPTSRVAQRAFSPLLASFRTSITPTTLAARSSNFVPSFTRSTIRPLRQPTSSPFSSFAPINSPRLSQSHNLKRFTRRQLRFNSSTPSKPTSPNPTANLGSPPIAEKSLSLSQRLRKLSREYGWSALGVYLALSALDFPFCFTAVRLLGTDRIGRWEHAILEWVKRAMPLQIPGWNKKSQAEVSTLQSGGATIGMVNTDQIGEPVMDQYDHGVKDAETALKNNASIWTQLALAYAIHKSFIFIRVPLTAAVTPKVVKTLRGWGWDIGKRPAKKALETARKS
ncbi:hypothetical protein MMC25_002076 [Agyrium rufum]|nr:hypothetical protein [Agyrium rufum]